MEGPPMFKFIMPLMLFATLVIFLGLGLGLNPSKIPSPLLNQPAPEFSLPLLARPETLASKADMIGNVWLLNVWASWCAACRTEHPVLNQLAAQNTVPIIGLNYKDQPEAAQQWLVELGDPYYLSVIDKEGRVGIDYGVYGVPETFVIDKKGWIRYKHTGALTLDDVRQTLLPLIAQLTAASE